MSKKNFDELNSMQRYLQFAVFDVDRSALEGEREAIAADARKFFENLKEEGKVHVRGIYDVSGIQAKGEFMIWFIAEEWEYITEALNAFRCQTMLGRASEPAWFGNGAHRPAEFNRSHLPSFIMGEDPNPWITVYPFVRSYDWYVMDPQERRRILMEHGKAARDYPDVRANTVAAFVMGDYEWMLCFEGPNLGRLIDLMHTMRYTDARLHVRHEIPFYTGRRVDDVDEIVGMFF